MTLSLLPLIHKFLLLCDGRDKSLKLFQYTFKIALIHLHLASRKPLLAGHLKNAAASFSTTRKMLRLGHWIPQLYDIVQLTQSKSAAKDALTQANLALGLCNDLADDIYCLGKIGALPKKAMAVENLCNQLWFISIVYGLIELRFSRQELKKSEKKDTKMYWNTISMWKLLMDLIFCSYDVFRLDAVMKDKGKIQAWTGLFSAILATHKLWVKVHSK